MAIVHRTGSVLITMTACLALTAATPAHAEGDGAFEITRSTVDSGGGVSVGGTFVLTGTVGQPDAHEECVGGTFAATAGFWPLALGASCVPGGDTDGDDCVAFSDVLVVIGQWGMTGPAGDADCNGIVDFADLLAVIGEWGTGTGCE